MKKLFTLMLSLSIVHISWSTGNTAYQKAMQKSITALKEAHDIASMTKVAHHFERIAKMEKDKWLPRYYAAYAYITTGAMEESTTQKDQCLDQAQSYLDETLALEAKNSELVALQGYLYMIRVSVDPASRGQQLASKATQTLSQAVQMDTENPRALLLLGQMQYGTAQFFNNNTSEACSLIEQSLEKFATASDAEELAPSWGKEIALAVQERCNQ